MMFSDSRLENAVDLTNRIIDPEGASVRWA